MPDRPGLDLTAADVRAGAGPALDVRGVDVRGDDVRGDELPGLDLAALTRWFDAEQPDLRRGALAGEVLAGGRSNLTYRISDAVSTWALRRPPLGHVLPTAHDMAREYRLISALAPTDVPVAEPIAFCSDDAVLGAPFYLMSFVDGVVLDRPAAMRALDQDAARAVCEQLVDSLVRLHAVDPAAVGLADFGRPDGFLERQVRRWHTQWKASRTGPPTEPDAVVAALLRRLPPPAAPGIVHGDYRLTNVIYRPDLTGIAAVVDWEMATLGDPLTDVGLLAVYQGLSLHDDLLMPRMSPADGFLTAEQMVERYTAQSGRDPADLAWYLAFSCFKLAVIAEGIHHRYLQGKTVGPGFDRIGAAVPQLLATALEHAERS